MVVTGTPGTQDGVARVLAHIGIGATGWEPVRREWNLFATTVENSGMTNLRGYIYLVDTRAASLPPAERQYLAVDTTTLQDLNDFYRRLQFALQQLVGLGNPVTKRIHPFSQTGTMQVDRTNTITTSP
jgi:hypothetical protein